MLKRILSLALVVLLVAALFVGCGSAKPEGTYKLKTIDGKNVKEALLEEIGDDASEEDLDDYLELLGIESVEDMLTLTLESGGDFALTYVGEEMKGTWELDGDKLTLTNEDGEDAEATFKNGEIIIDMGDGEMVLGK